jgi:integrase
MLRESLIVLGSFQMTVRRRGGVYWYDFQIGGVRYRGSTRRHSKGEARLIEAVKRRDVLALSAPLCSEGKRPVGPAEIRLFNAVNRWYSVYGGKLKDAPQLARTINIMFDGTGSGGRRKWTWRRDLKLHELTEGAVKTFINNRIAEGISAATIYAELSVLKRTVNCLRGEFRTPTITWPSSRHDKRLTPNAKERWLTNGEIAELRAYLDPQRERIGLPPPTLRSQALMQRLQDIYDLFEFILYTGARPSEAMTLPWARVDFPKRTVALRRTKTGVTTQMLMPERVLALLVRRRAQSKSIWVFPSVDDPSRPRRICRAIGAAMDALGFNEPWKVEQLGGRAVMYTLRDTYASRLAQTGNHSLQEIALMLGHKSTRMTEKYARLVPSQVAARIASTINMMDEPEPRQSAEVGGRECSDA